MAANSQAVPENKRDRFGFQTITSVMDSVGTVWVFVLLVIINLDICGRALFNHPMRGVPEIVAMSIVALVFIQIAHTLAVGRLTRSDVFLAWLVRTKPRLGYTAEGVFNLVGAGLFFILFWTSVPLFVKAWRINEYVGAEGDFKLPVWPVKLIVLIGCAAACIQFFLLAWKNCNKVMSPPDAVPEGGSGE